MKFSIYLPAVLICLLSTSLSAGEKLDFDDETVRVNYSLGHQIGGDFRRQGVEMNAEAVVQGIRDALEGIDPQMSPAEMRTTLVELKRKVVADQHERRARREVELLKEGEEFLKQNAKKEGVITTESGLQYMVIKEGEGVSPGPQDQVTVHYKGTFIDGRSFHDTYKKGKPATFWLNGVVKGWSEGLQLMKAGGKSRMFIPQNLAYGQRGALAHRTLIFDVELISVEKPKPEGPAKATPQEKAKSGA